MTNYLAVPNPFALAEPPAWFLQQLAVFDPDLVIFPSQEEAVFRVARRVRRMPPTAQVSFTLLRHRPDTRIYAQHRLVPVTTILSGRWSPAIFADLAERDLWRVGGADRACDLLEAREAADEARQRRALASDARDLAGLAWHMKQSRLGEWIDLGQRPGVGRGAPRPAPRPAVGAGLHP
jgi:hypothetical protein